MPGNNSVKSFVGHAALLMIHAWSIRLVHTTGTPPSPLSFRHFPAFPTPPPQLFEKSSTKNMGTKPALQEKLKDGFLKSKL
jgi:hypothetical protein